MHICCDSTVPNCILNIYAWIYSHFKLNTKWDLLFPLPKPVKMCSCSYTQYLLFYQTIFTPGFNYVHYHPTKQFSCHFHSKDLYCFLSKSKCLQIVTPTNNSNLTFYNCSFFSKYQQQCISYNSCASVLLFSLPGNTMFSVKSLRIFVTATNSFLFLCF